MKDYEIDEIEINDAPLGITDEEYNELGDLNDAN